MRSGMQNLSAGPRSYISSNESEGETVEVDVDEYDLSVDRQAKSGGVGGPGRSLRRSHLFAGDVDTAGQWSR